MILSPARHVPSLLFTTGFTGFTVYAMKSMDLKVVIQYMAIDKFQNYISEKFPTKGFTGYTDEIHGSF